MPRGRGGARQGDAGTAYGNRTDLNMPISTVPGQEYGKAAQQEAAQSAVPMAASPVAPVQTEQPVQAVQYQPMPRPGSLPYLDTTMRPTEPVTAGMPFGPGPGPEALDSGYSNVSQVLQSALNRDNPSSYAVELASAARLLGM